MKTLFMLIVSIVFGIGSFISPTDFRSKIENPEPTSTPQPTNKIFPTTEPVPVVLDNEEYSGDILDNPNEGYSSDILDNPDEEEIYVLRPAAETATAESAPSDNNNEAGGYDYSKPQVEDNFERGSAGFGLNAGLNDDENIRIIALNNQLSLIPKKSNGWLTWRLRPPVVQNGAAKMEFSITTCARGDRFGIAMHENDYTSGNGYYFSLACEGTVSILRDNTVLGTADASRFFHNNSGDVNDMTAIIRGNTLIMELNNETVLTVEDSTYTQGFSGFFTSPQGQNTLTMDILSFKEYYQ